jgi:hypothetical protein
MAAPGFSAESAIYRSTMHYQTLASMIGIAGIGSLQPLSPSALNPISGLATGFAARGSCTIRRLPDGSRVLDYSAQTDFDGKPLIVHITNTTGARNEERLRVAVRPVKSDIRVTLEGADVVNMVSQSAPDAVTTLGFAYGRAIAGVRNAAITIRNGIATGNVDGREIVPTPLSEGTKSFRFEDGRPAPSLTVDPRLSAAIGGLLESAGPGIKNCQRNVSSPNVPMKTTGPVDHGQMTSSPFLVLGRSEPAHRIVPAGVPPQHSSCNPDASEKCSACRSNCDVEFGICLGGTTVGCVFTFGAGCAAYAGCIAEEVRCHSNCDGPGGDCCPQTCSGLCCCDSDQCCGGCCPEDNVCSNQLCCPPDHPVGCSAAGDCYVSGSVCCGSTGCPPGQHCSDPSQSLCCPSGRDACGSVCCPTGWCQPGNVCCPPGKPICAGDCCDGGVCDRSGKCCMPPFHLCGGVCCPPFNPCCGNVCCDFGSVCVAGHCCPVAQACGNVCCPSGQSCQDPSRGICGACPPGTESVICQNEGGGSATACCPPNVHCCNGKCCPFASDRYGPVVCCAPVGGDVAPFNNAQFGCHHSFACTH